MKSSNQSGVSILHTGNSRWIAPVHELSLWEEPGGGIVRVVVRPHTPEYGATSRRPKNFARREYASQMELEKLQAQLKSRIQQHKVLIRTQVSTEHKVLCMQIWKSLQPQCLKHLVDRVLFSCFVHLPGFGPSLVVNWAPLSGRIYLIANPNEGFSIYGERSVFDHFSPYPSGPPSLDSPRYFYLSTTALLSNVLFPWQTLVQRRNTDPQVNMRFFFSIVSMF